MINTSLLGRIRLRFGQAKAKLDKKGQRAKVAPNFVHSYDAAHLMLTIVNAEGEQGRPMSWAMVHDSYGTHAGDCDMLGQVLREQFVLMYDGKDPLGDFAAQVAAELPEGAKCPTPPAMGTFDLSEVLDAEFFFA